MAFVIVDYTNQKVAFVGASLQSVKDYLLLIADENDWEDNEYIMESAKNLPLDLNKMVSYFWDNLGLTLTQHLLEKN